MTGIFVTGTDTGVGKTFTCAWLLRHWQVDYWKPVQSGCEEDSDSDMVAALGRPAMVHPCAWLLKAPLSPHEAARLEGVTIRLEDFTLPASPRPIVVEGAGGALVPLNDHAMMADLMVRLGLPVIVTARSGLGTINHTLLTLEALRRRGIVIAGVVMNGPPDAANRRAIEQFGQVRVIAEIPPLADIARDIGLLPPPPALESLL